MVRQGRDRTEAPGASFYQVLPELVRKAREALNLRFLGFLQTLNTAATAGRPKSAQDGLRAVFSTRACNGLLLFPHHLEFTIRYQGQENDSNN